MYGVGSAGIHVCAQKYTSTGTMNESCAKDKPNITAHWCNPYHHGEIHITLFLFHDVKIPSPRLWHVLNRIFLMVWDMQLVDSNFFASHGGIPPTKEIRLYIDTESGSGDIVARTFKMFETRLAEHLPNPQWHNWSLTSNPHFRVRRKWKNMKWTNASINSLNTFEYIWEYSSMYEWFYGWWLVAQFFWKMLTIFTWELWKYLHACKKRKTHPYVHIYIALDTGTPNDVISKTLPIV